mmetsp:Transcript_18261/g.33941  ORF Transcript_18261/g.33941 Transcript_18261/m.33941 type:complete len:97 (+) Transcript_18261:1093-1383(+)
MVLRNRRRGFISAWQRTKTFVSGITMLLHRVITIDSHATIKKKLDNMIEESHGVFARSRVGWAEDKKCLSGVAFLFELQRNERQTTAILRFTSYDD